MKSIALIFFVISLGTLLGLTILAALSPYHQEPDRE